VIKGVGSFYAAYAPATKSAQPQISSAKQTQPIFKGSVLNKEEIGEDALELRFSGNTPQPQQTIKTIKTIKNSQNAFAGINFNTCRDKQ